MVDRGGCEDSPAALKYKVVPPRSWDDTLAQRAVSHFNKLALFKLYAAQAADELVNTRRQLVTTRSSSGLAGVRGHLLERADSCRQGRLNGWRTAAYEAWANDDRFCDGGFAPTG